MYALTTTQEVSTEEPKTYSQVVESTDLDNSNVAMDEEIRSLLNNQIWELVQ